MTIINQTRIRLSVGDALKALFGKAISLSTEIDVSTEVQVIATRQTIYVEPIIHEKESGTQAQGYSHSPLGSAFDQQRDTFFGR